jgi:hypothetical protein
MSRLAGIRRMLTGGVDYGPRLDRMSYSIGALHAVMARQAPTIKKAEFRCFSQFGEDGIIQWLLARVPIEDESFVEFGVGDYRESNTRFLLEHDDWKGFILDAGDEHLHFLDQGDLRWRHTVDARSAFITRENINDLLSPVAGEVGLLSIDVDGNDYWIWEVLEVVDARIVIVEFNSVFGSERAVSVPYDPAFDRSKAHPSWLYWGASLPAMVRLGHQKGYQLVGTNSAGHNAFFVRRDVGHSLEDLTADQAWHQSRYRESRGSDGQLTYVTSHEDRRSLMAAMPLVDVSTGKPLLVSDL